jgi:DNA-binding transcriptional regulator YiaG
MKNSSYHYTECGLDNIYLSNGFKFKATARGRAVSIHDIDGLHRAIGLHLVMFKKDLTGQEVRFLRHEMLLSQSTLGQFLGVSEQTVHRWENNKTTIPKSSECLLRLLYREHIHDRNGKISAILKQIADLEDKMNNEKIVFKDTLKGWKSAA